MRYIAILKLEASLSAFGFKQSQIDKLTAYAFEYACKEAEYLCMEKSGPDFQWIVRRRETQILHYTVEAFHQLKAKVKKKNIRFNLEDMDLNLPTGRQMEASIRKLYDGVTDYRSVL